jgi:hypothetical protein
MWRITTAQEMCIQSPVPFRNVLHSIGALLPVEVPEEQVFVDIAALQHAMHAIPAQQHILERVGVLRGLHSLGYINKKDVPCLEEGMLHSGMYTETVCRAVASRVAVCTQIINKAFVQV